MKHLRSMATTEQSVLTPSRRVADALTDAGITVTVALIALYIARGARWVEMRLRVAPLRWMGMGLVLTLIAGTGSMVAGYPFLTSFADHVDLPLLGSVPLVSALVFDLGVFCVVVGACSLILVVLAHQSLRRPVPAPSPAADEEAID